MVCKITSINWLRGGRARSGTTLPETVMGLGISTIVMAAVCGFALLNARGFAGFSSYTALDLANRAAMDQMTKDFRMCQSLTNFASNAISLVDFDGTSLKYTYSSTNQTLTRTKGTTNTVLVRDCNRFTFSMSMRDMTNATFDFEPTTNVIECKALTMDWCCSRKLPTGTSDDMPQLHTVVIRN
jgi:hypothetical protein